ncbi:acetyl-CoA synthetase [Podochytrium sp. JEL0797]|nr:acetyl-CoA synthetase [Podochytrium sp. JEL0797]
MSHIASLEEYQQLYKKSIEEPEVFWETIAREEVEWSIPFEDGDVVRGNFAEGSVAWFSSGFLNVCVNCVDRHAAVDPNRTALIHEADEPGQDCKISYGELLVQVSRFANALRSLGVSKGDTVAIYLPMIPQAVYAMLACARIGAVHSVVFAGFSAESLAGRIQDAKSKILITSDQGKRGGKTVHLKQIADLAHVIVFRRTGDPMVPFTAPRDVWWHEVISSHDARLDQESQGTHCEPELMNAEDPLFILYTSGSTGKPKGVLHTSAGFLISAIVSLKYAFEVRPGDVNGCMADVGWITGHTYGVYGPLGLGVTTLVFESTPTYPNASRFWQTVDKHGITQLWSSPTALRHLRKCGDEFVTPFDLSTLRILGCNGEPINPEVWDWYNTVVGRNRCVVVDNYWQTETGTIVVSAIPHVTETKPGSATVPFFGIELGIVDAETGEELVGDEEVTGVLVVKNSWPSMFRTVYGDHERFLDTYMRPYPGCYFTGDGARRDSDGYYWITGRVDDVISVSGHRLSTSEIESALIQHPLIAESAAVAIPDELTGQAIVCFCTLKDSPNSAPQPSTDDLKQLSCTFRRHVRTKIGPIATPQSVYVVADLPKTRSGKIMRRVLKRIAAGEVSVKDVKDEAHVKRKLGDVSTLIEPAVVGVLVDSVARQA